MYRTDKGGQLVKILVQEFGQPVIKILKFKDGLVLIVLQREIQLFEVNEVD